MSMFQKIKKVGTGITTGAVLMLLPLVAQGRPVVGYTSVRTVGDVVGTLRDLINQITPVIVGLAVFLIIWGIFRYIASSGDEDAHKKAGSLIMWGVIGVFAMISIWGLVNILRNTFQLEIDPVKNIEVIP